MRRGWRFLEAMAGGWNAEVDHAWRPRHQQNPVIDAFLEAGVNCMHPMEPAAGMDIVKVREKFGARLAFYGGIDKHVLRGTKADIRRELEYKIPPMLQTGGCVLALDHRVTNGTPLENYRYYIDTVWEILAEHGG
jgi:uroporphyrinogen-III decarboxylase